MTETDGVYGREPFVDATAAPRLTASSPCVGAGRPDGAVSGDHDGRCYAQPPAIGAFAAP